MACSGKLEVEGDHTDAGPGASGGNSSVDHDAGGVDNSDSALDQDAAPYPGKLGQPCVGLAGGVTVPPEEGPYCTADGLICNSAGLCAPPELCGPENHDPTCVIYQGEANADIRALSINGGFLYWSEYGGFDTLGNYTQEGAIKQAPLGGGEVVTVLPDLPGPSCLAVTDSNFFVRVDRVVGSLASVETALWRVPRPEGKAEPVQKGDWYSCARSAGDGASFVAGVNGVSSVYTLTLYFVAADGNTRLLSSDLSSEFHWAYSEGYLYYYAGGLWRVSVQGGTPEQVSSMGVGEQGLAVGGSTLLRADQSELYRLELGAGGIWTTVFRPESGRQIGWEGLQMAGNRYYVQTVHWGEGQSGFGFWSGILEPFGPPSVLFRGDAWNLGLQQLTDLQYLINPTPFASATDGLYWRGRNTIYFTAVSVR
jgi:hypothetical protein